MSYLNKADVESFFLQKNITAGAVEVAAVEVVPQKCCSCGVF